MLRIKAVFVREITLVEHIKIVVFQQNMDQATCSLDYRMMNVKVYMRVYPHKYAYNFFNYFQLKPKSI